MTRLMVVTTAMAWDMPSLRPPWLMRGASWMAGALHPTDRQTGCKRGGVAARAPALVSRGSVQHEAAGVATYGSAPVAHGAVVRLGQRCVGAWAWAW